MRDARKARAAFIKGLPMTEARRIRREERARQAAERAARGPTPSSGNAVLDAARLHFEAYANNCSGFVRAVAGTLGVGAGMSGNADSQIDHMRSSWQTLSREEAIERAAQGAFVVAGLRSDEHASPRTHGHVAVVVPGELYRGTYPRVWSGSLGGIAGRSEGDRSVGQIWRVDDRDRVQYFTPPPAGER